VKPPSHPPRRWSSAPSSPTAADVVSALRAAVERIPGVLVYARDHCHGHSHGHGHDWLIKPGTLEVHVNGELNPAEYNAARSEALAALELYLINQETRPPSIPAPRCELALRRWRRTS
jgi:hypothetical protein